MHLPYVLHRSGTRGVKSVLVSPVIRESKTIVEALRKSAERIPVGLLTGGGEGRGFPRPDRLGIGPLPSLRIKELDVLADQD